MRAVKKVLSVELEDLGREQSMAAIFDASQKGKQSVRTRTVNGASPAAVGGRTKTCPSPDNKLTRRKGQQMSRCQ